MSERELYEIARRRISQRNRRWMLWSVNLGILILMLAGLILTEGSRTALTLFLGWGAVFVTHTLIVSFAEATQGSIENEVVKLRKAFEANVYEKPKRIELGEDGELTEADDTDWGRDDAARSRHSARG